jgi:hypothetical protein
MWYYAENGQYGIRVTAVVQSAGVCFKAEVRWLFVNSQTDSQSFIDFNIKQFSESVDSL